MNFYWSDREGKPPETHAKLKFRPFFSQKTRSLQGNLCTLPPPATAKIIKQKFLPDKETWCKQVEQALELIQKKALQKVVLARTSILELDQTPNPFALTAALKQKAEGAFLFCLQTERESFLGATPERLFYRKGREIFSEAIAGTRRLGKAFEEELLKSSKDLREFSPVQSYIQKALTPLCLTPPSFSPITVHKTANVQHLYSQCKSMLKETVTDEEILSSLHPTPALCGLPKEAAFPLIQELEPFDRGLYGGAIGWSTPESSEWIVGIRSCLLQGNIATLFSGTGIVEGSDPEKEWDELNQKIKLYDGILDH